MEVLILLALALWLVFAVRSTVRHKGGCGGNCAGCSGCGKREAAK